MPQSKYIISQRVGDKLLKFGNNTLNKDFKSLYLASQSSRKFKLTNSFAHLFPKGYPASVASGYKKYAIGQAVAMSLSAAGGVLSTKALLVGLGVGAASAAPLAGTLNWIIKDGIGQIGGIAFAGLVSDRFDENPKRWRLLSSMAMDASAVLELCTPLFPTYFLPIAAAANIGKNISFLASSASRASLNRSLASHSNLADVTAKCGSQSIMASMLGTGLGILIASIIPGQYRSVTLQKAGNSALDAEVMNVRMDLGFWQGLLPVGFDTHATLTIGCFLALTAGSLTANYLSLKHVPATSLTLSKFDLLLSNFWEQHQNRQTQSEIQTENLPALRLLQPSELSSRDIFLLPPPLYPKVEYAVGGTLLEAATCIEDVNLLVSEFSDDQYCIAAYGQCNSRSRPRALLLFKESAGERDVLLGLVHLHVVRRLLSERMVQREGALDSPGLDLDVVREARQLLTMSVDESGFSLADQFLKELRAEDDAQGCDNGDYDPETRWVVDTFVLEKNKSRFTVTSSTVLASQ